MNIWRKYSLIDIITYGLFTVRYEILSELFSNAIFALKCYLLRIRFGREYHVFGRVDIIKFPGSVVAFGDRFNLISCSKKSGAAPVNPVRLKTFSPTAEISIGNNVDLNGTSIACRSKRVVIGDNTLIAPNVYITDSDFHCLEPQYRLPGSRKSGIENDKDVIIGKNVWIGMNCIILKGSKIGDNTVVGAGCVVTGCLEPNSVYIGSRIQQIRAI